MATNFAWTLIVYNAGRHERELQLELKRERERERGNKIDCYKI